MNPLGGRFLAAAASVAMIAAIAAGLWVLGPPSHQRALRLDAQRMTSLNMLSFAVGSYWNEHKTLPDNLQAVNVAINDKDPVSGVAYTYIPGTKDRYQLCAVFDAPSGQTGSTVWKAGIRAPGWKHPAGRHCFDLSATRMGMPEAGPDFYPGL